MTEFFNVLRVSRDDLVPFIGPLAHRLSDDMMEHISDKMVNEYLMGAFWAAVELIAVPIALSSLKEIEEFQKEEERHDLLMDFLEDEHDTGR